MADIQFALKVKEDAFETDDIHYPIPQLPAHHPSIRTIILHRFYAKGSLSVLHACTISLLTQVCSTIMSCRGPMDLIDISITFYRAISPVITVRGSV